MTKFEQSMDVFMREFREIDKEAEERFFTHQRATQERFMEWEERQAEADRKARKEDSQNQREATKEMAEMLAGTIRQCFMSQTQHTAPPPQYSPYNRNQMTPQSFSYQTPRRSASNSTPRTIQNIDSGHIYTEFTGQHQ